MRLPDHIESTLHRDEDIMFSYFLLAAAPQTHVCDINHKGPGAYPLHHVIQFNQLEYIDS